MASRRSAQYPVQWADGSWHSKTQAGPGVTIGNTPVSAQQWASGGLAEALVPGSTAPGGVAGPQVTAQPIDPAYEAYKQGAGFDITTGNNEAAWQTGQTAFNTGYNADGSTNASNPYSQAQLFQDSYHTSQLGTTNGMAAQGQLYSGANLNAQATNDRNYSIGSNALKTQTAATYHGIGNTQLVNYGANAAGGSAAGFAALSKSVYPNGG